MIHNCKITGLGGAPQLFFYLKEAVLALFHLTQIFINCLLLTNKRIGGRRDFCSQPSYVHKLRMSAFTDILQKVKWLK